MRCLVCLTLIVCTVTSAPLFANEGAGTVRDGVTGSGQFELRQLSPRSSRLKFRSGPVCMCSGGLSEAQINAAERTRKQAETARKKIIGEQ